jgi:hypothetical protein
MKHKCSVTEVYIRRDRVILPKLYSEAKKVATYPTTMKKLCQIVSRLETPYYCISDDAALDYVRKRKLHGIKKTYATKYKQKLFEALYDEFEMLASQDSYKDKGLQTIVIAALERKAPCIGLTPWIIQYKLSKIQKERKR